MNRMPKQDDLLIARFLDGEMGVEERATFAARLDAEPGLAAAHKSASAAARSLQVDRSDALRAPANFSDKVLSQVRRMPSRAEITRQVDDEVAVERAVSFGRSFLVAALIIFGVAVLFTFSLMRKQEGELLRAQGDTKLMQELDAKVKELRSSELRSRK